MTIFDTLRYPIPDNATAWCQIPALPNEIIREFERQRDEAFDNRTLKRSDDLGIVKLLRKVILEYNDNI